MLRGWGITVEDLPDDEAQSATAPSSASEQAGAGITAMADLLAEPDVRSIVAGFRESFEVVCQQIDRLGNYKDLHDLLHDLQFNCYNPIARGARDFPNNALFLESLIDYQAELQRIANSLWEVAERAAFSANERVWIEQVGQAAGLLRDAIEQLSRLLLDRTTLQIGRVLYIYPARINERLKEAARSLPLPSLIGAMVAVRQHAPRTELSAVRLGQIERGIAALERLEEALSHLIVEHDIWQDVDLELHRVGEALDPHVTEIEWLWPDVKIRVEPMCASRSDRWTQDLRQASDKLDRALAARTMPAITIAFRAYRRQVGLCFFQADKQLKELCRDMRRVDGPLNAVMSMIT